MARPRTKAPSKGKAKSPANQPPPAAPFRDAQDVLADGGVTPLDVMIGTMRALWQEAHASAEPDGDSPAPPPEPTDGAKSEGPPDLRLRDRALAIAEKVAPYVHPRARPVEPLAAAAEPQALAIEIVFIKPDGADPPPD